MKPTVGYFYSRKNFNLTDTLLIEELRKKMNLVLIVLEKQVDYEKIHALIKPCRYIFNNAGFEPRTFEGVELTKTFEEMGKKVINSSQSFYYQEDKWMFYLKCLRYNLPTPKTYLIPKEGHDPKQIRKILKHGPLVLKAVFSDSGIAVEKVVFYKMFRKKLKKIVAKSPTSPIIAQKYIPNDRKSYRVTLIGHKVVQSVVKIGKNWKQTGWKESEYYEPFRIDKKLKNICEKASKKLKMDICGLDLVRNSGKWYLIEANSCPAFDFIENEEVRLIKKVADYLYKLCVKLKQKH